MGKNRQKCHWTAFEWWCEWCVHWVNFLVEKNTSRWIETSLPLFSWLNRIYSSVRGKTIFLKVGFWPVSINESPCLTSLLFINHRVYNTTAISQKNKGEKEKSTTTINWKRRRRRTITNTYKVMIAVCLFSEQVPCKATNFTTLSCHTF